jgi:hypothetical protein
MINTGKMSVAQSASAIIEAGRKELDLLHPIGHMGEPDDIAYGIFYLASDESKLVTGAELVIDGGYRTHLGSIIYAIANLFNISLTKQRLSFVVAFLRVLSKFFTKLLHLSIQELLLSITHLALAVGGCIVGLLINNWNDYTWIIMFVNPFYWTASLAPDNW